MSGEGGVDLIDLIDNQDKRLAWEFVSLAKYLNMSYIEVKNLAADELMMLSQLMCIDKLCQTDEGIKVLETNIRLKQTEPEVEKLRKKYGGD